ncbi:MAG: hypothetical protein GEEBNDBF_01435 [bacterium]|nr:hypothetical protein [bacterium]
MRQPSRASLMRLCWLLLLPNLLLSMGARGEGIASGCFSRPTFAHNRGLPHLKDAVVFATAAPDTLQIYSISQARVTNTLKTADRLLDMEVASSDPQGRPFPRAYVSTKSARVASYDLLRNSVVAEVKLSEDPDATGGAIAVSPDGKYVATGIGDIQFNIRSIAVLDAANLSRRLASIEIGGDLQDLVANPHPNRPELYIINDRAAKVRIFDFNTLTMSEGIFDLTGSPSDFAVSPDGRMAIASINARNKVVFIDLEKRQLVFEIVLPEASPHRIAFAPDANTAYITDRRVANSMIYRIDLLPIREAMRDSDYSRLNAKDLVSGKHLPALLAREAYVPHGAAVSSDGDFLYLTFSNQTRFAVVNLRDIDSLVEEHPRMSFLTQIAAQQWPLTSDAFNDGLFEIQGFNLAKNPETFHVLHDSNLVFSFTSEVGKKGGQPPPVAP